MFRKFPGERLACLYAKLKAKEIIALMRDARKASAVKACFEGEISPLVTNIPLLC
jgi:hypothetical protein